jgi:cyclopropane-fatty-acyl-phospholipid synthase
MDGLIQAVEKGWVPDPLVRFGIRRLCRQRLAEERQSNVEAQEVALLKYVRTLRESPVAVATREANEQHYELPPEFFTLVLGPRRKYSACYWTADTHNLEAAEIASLRQVCERAQLRDGLEILELGCGWGSLTLWMAEHYPDSRITAVSNSRPQKAFIDAECARRGFRNVTVITQDINVFEPGCEYDRVVSIEMFEHVRNYDHLMMRVATWLRMDGLLFVHIFAHRELPYLFETEGADNWMGRYFFTGGQMPSKSLLLFFQGALGIEEQWVLNGSHYAKTSNAWLANMDARRAAVMDILRRTYGAEASLWWNRWRVFFMSVAELFDYEGGEEWVIAHHLFRRKL